MVRSMLLATMVVCHGVFGVQDFLAPWQHCGNVGAFDSPAKNSLSSTEGLSS